MKLNIFIKFLLTVAMTGVFPVVAITAKAEETENIQYTSVVKDLQKDESFNVEAYPSVANDYALEVIQIAESVNKELFLYVYQPSDEVKELTATKVSLSTAINENFYPLLYDLTLISTEGVFDKYKVEGLTVKEDAVRYYSIVRLQRDFDETIDKPSETDNEIIEVSEEVGQLWTACTVGDNVSYQCITEETIEITDKWTGFVRYNDGFKLHIGACDSWFIAFNTEKRIDKLMEATIGYSAREYEQYRQTSEAQPSVYYGELKFATVDLSNIDKVNYEADGLFGKTYEWGRIESVETFKNDTALTDEAKENLKGKQWVLRFLETKYSKTYPLGGVIYTTGTEVAQETILRLKFETNGQAYNLGVVDNELTPDTIPDGGSHIAETPDWIERLLEWIKTHPKEALIILLAIIICLPIVISLLPSLIKLLFYVVLSPLLFLSWLGKLLNRKR